MQKIIVDEITETVIEQYIEKENAFIRALKRNAAAEELEELHAERSEAQAFTLDYLLNSYFGYDVKEINGTPQWCKVVPKER